MNERQKRLIEVYEHLRRYYGIHTKTGFAEALHYGRTSLSAAMNGDESYLTDNLFKNICDTYPGVFNLNYLLNGDGALMTIKEEVSNERLEKLVNPQKEIDQSSLVNAALAAKDETIRSKDETIATLRDTIESLKRENTLLRQQLNTYRISEQIEHSSFSIGVADNGERTSSEYVNART